MIWGQIINEVRSLHLEFLDQYSISPHQFSSDIELTVEQFPFPTLGENFEDWETTILPEKIQEALELHAVERALIEGPLLPIQEVLIQNHEWETLILAILGLEKDWMIKTKLFTDEKYSFIELTLRAKLLQLQRRSSRFALKVV